MCSLEAHKVKLVYCLLYRETAEHPTYAQRLSEAAICGESSQPNLLHSTAEKDRIGQMKVKLLTWLNQERSYVGGRHMFLF